MHWLAHVHHLTEAHAHDDPALEITTWFLAMPDHTVCREPRLVQLRQNFLQWQGDIVQAWQDFLDPLWPVNLHVVRPTPPVTMYFPARRVHVLVIQRPPPDGVGNLFTAIVPGQVHEPTWHLARFAPLQLDRHQAIFMAEVNQLCFPERTELQCMVWHGEFEIRGRLAVRNRPGLGFVVIVQEELRPPDTTGDSFWEVDEDSDSLLQIMSQQQLKVRQVLSLETLIPTTTAVRLLDCTALHCLPNPIEVSLPGTADQVREELVLWGHKCQVYSCQPFNTMLCIDDDIDFSPLVHYVFCHDDPEDVEGRFIHSVNQPMTELEMMSHLCSLGHPRAVILADFPLRDNWHNVVFHHREPEVHSHQRPRKVASDWPTRGSAVRTCEPLVNLDRIPCLQAPARLSTDFDINDLRQLFDSSFDLLCLDVEGLDLAPELRSELDRLPVTAVTHASVLDNFDRLLIFTDGSSLPAMKHFAPEHADSLGWPDTWAFAVAAEKFVTDTFSEVHFLGWTAQPVRYDDTGSAYMGITKIGADAAERAGLIGAAMWRLGLNHSISTVFCTDSTTGQGQAQGSQGVSSVDASYLLLRGLFQALEHALPGQALRIEHINAHAGMLLNEIVDTAAKQEMKKSWNLKRQPIDLSSWATKFTQLWTLFGDRSGLPAWENGGLNVRPPTLPSCGHDAESGEFHPRQATWTSFTFSVATANIQALYKGPLGHAGKLHYLQAQMHQFGLNCLALQETRSEAGMTRAGNILRFSTGHVKGQYGIEVWFDMERPFTLGTHGAGHLFHPSHFLIVYTDPRRMFLRCDTGQWTFWMLVLHAPHSGYDAQHRQRWWDETLEIVDQHHDGDTLFLLGDMNAAPGDEEAEIVCGPGFATSANTNDFKRLLRHLDLHLPVTTDLHSGSTCTWTNFDGTSEHCIDHIAIPRTWRSCCTMSTVLEDFDLATLHDDHKAIAIQLQWNSLILPHQDADHVLPYRHKSVAYPVHPDLDKALKDLSPLPWDYDNDQQVHHITQGLHDVLKSHSPSGVERAKKTFISEEIWKVRENKIAYKRKISALRHRVKFDLLAKVWHAWKQGDHPQAESIHLYEVSLHCAAVKLFVQYKLTCRNLKHQLTQAKQQRLIATLDTLDSATPAAQVLRTLKPFTGPTNVKKLKKSNIPVIVNELGERCSLPCEALAVWVRYFQEMEGGERMTHADLRERWICELAQLQRHHLDWPLSRLPSLTELEVALRRVQCGKANGPDGLPGEVCRHHPVALARLLYPQLIKLVVHGEESLAFKGGIVAPIYKGKGPVDRPSSYRSILVSNHLGKALHRTLRQSQSSLYERFLQSQQTGGRRKIPVQLAMHQTRAFTRYAKCMGLSASVIFLDLQEAFYRVVREVPLGGVASDDLVAHIMHKLNMPEDSLHQIHALLGETPALQQAGFSEVDQTCVRAVHQSTHFWLRTQRDVVRTRVGSRPGDCFADLIFGYAWSCVLHKLEQSMRESGTLTTFPVQQRLPLFGQECSGDGVSEFLGPTWMDDLSVCVVSPTAAALPSLTCQVTGTLIDICTFHCMTPNIARGKTEVMMMFRGGGSRKEKVAYYGPEAPHTLPVLCETGLRPVQLVKHYKHLGGISHHTTDQHTEVRQRIGIGHQAFNQHRRVLFQNSQIERPKRVELFHILVVTKVLYGSDSWVAMNIRTMQYFTTAIFKLYRRLLKLKPSSHVSDEEVLDMLAVPHPEELLRRARLRYLGTLMQTGLPHLWDLLATDREWTGLLEEDIVWLWQQLRNSSNLPDPRVSFEPWRNLMEFRPGFWKRLIKRATTHAVQQRSRCFRARLFHQAALQRLGDALPEGLVPLSQPSSTLDTVFGCMGCRKRCKNRAGEAAHMQKKHKQPSLLRHLFDSPVCPACLKFFHTMAKVKAHLHYSEACRQRLRDQGMHCAVEPGAGSTQDMVRVHEHDCLLPPLVGQGPCLPVGRHREHLAIDEGLYDHVLQALEHQDTAHALDLSIRTHAGTLALSWTRFVQTIEFALENFEQADADFFALDFEEVRAIFHGLCDHRSWDFFQEDEKTQCTLPSLSDLESQCKNMEQSLSEAAVLPAPRGFGKHRVLLHAYSGRRRRGDLQFYMENYVKGLEDYTLHVVSVDVVINSEWGDARKPETVNFWLAAIRDGFIIAFVAGPPCESWSQARGTPMKDTDTRSMQGFSCGPRIIRTLQALWGLESVTLRELGQLCVGNDLLFFALLAMIEIAFVDGVGILEHPAPPRQEDAASIWRTPIVKAMLALPNVEQVQFAQGLMGSA
eukprot:s1891_g6.t1